MPATSRQPNAGSGSGANRQRMYRDPANIQPDRPESKPSGKRMTPRTPPRWGFPTPECVNFLPEVPGAGQCLRQGGTSVTPCSQQYLNDSWRAGYDRDNHWRFVDGMCILCGSPSWDDQCVTTCTTVSTFRPAASPENNPWTMRQCPWRAGTPRHGAPIRVAIGCHRSTDVSTMATDGPVSSSPSAAATPAPPTARSSGHPASYSDGSRSATKPDQEGIAHPLLLKRNRPVEDSAPSQHRVRGGTSSRPVG